MNLLLSLILLLIIPTLVLSKQYKALVFLSLLSLICNLFYFEFFGTRIPLHSFVALCILPFILPYIKKQILNKKLTFLHFLSVDFLLLICLGVYFSFISPWEVFGDLGWNQNPLGRSIVALFRLSLDISMAIFIHYCITNGKVKVNTILKMAIGIALFQIGIGLFDFFTNYPFRTLLFTERQIPGRFLGFSHDEEYRKYRGKYYHGEVLKHEF